MSRGRLILPLVAVIAPLDVETMGTAGSYDNVFDEVKRVDLLSDGVGTLDRKEKAQIEVLAQVETDREEMQRLSPSGNVAETAIALVLHLSNLERLGYYNRTTGALSLKVGDRLVRIKSRNGRRTMMEFERVPVYCSHVKALGAFLGNDANLVLMQFEDRPQGGR